MWLIGFLYIVDKRSSVIRIALYIKQRFEDPNKGGGSEDTGCYYDWEHWLDSGGRELNGFDSELADKNCTDTLSIIDPTMIEFLLLSLIGCVNTIYLSYVGEHAQNWWMISLLLFLFSTVLGLWYLEQYLRFRNAKRQLNKKEKSK